MAEKLGEYNKKRNFNNTEEPQGKTEESGDGLRFVVQHHMARKEHYDFRLEWEGALLSWAVPKGPSNDTRDKRLTFPKDRTAALQLHDTEKGHFRKKAAH